MISKIKRPNIKIKRYVKDGQTQIFIDGMVLENVENININALIYETEENIVGKQKTLKKEVMGYEVTMKTYIPVDKIECDNFYR